jgi:hypothetical protein
MLKQRLKPVAVTGAAFVEQRQQAVVDISQHGLGDRSDLLSVQRFELRGLQLAYHRPFVGWGAGRHHQHRTRLVRSDRPAVNQLSHWGDRQVQIVEAKRHVPAAGDELAHRLVNLRGPPAAFRPLGGGGRDPPLAPGATYGVHKRIEDVGGLFAGQG